MKEQPDWGRYSDRQLQEAIASNLFLAVAWLKAIRLALIWLMIGLFGLSVRYFGWQTFLLAPWQ